MSESHYSPCQIKFAFDVSTHSPIEWYEYFGFEDGYDMIQACLKKHKLNSDTLEFGGTDSSGAKFTVVFETTCEPKDFQADYQKALDFLEAISKDPAYNDDSVVFQNMLDFLEDEDITIYDDDPDQKVFDEYNLRANGYKTYQENVAAIAKSKSDQE